MDIARPPQKKTGRNIGIGAGVVVLAGLGWWLAHLDKAAPTLDLAVAIIDSVQQGDMVRDVRGNGTLVPEQIQIVTAMATARVDKLDVQSGEVVKPGDVLLEMSSPETAIQAMNADQALNQAQATLLQLRTSLRSTELSQRGIVATTHTQMIAAQLDADASDSLVKKNLIAPNDANNKRALADELKQRYQYEQDRLADMIKSAPEQIASSEANIKQLEGIADFYHTKLKSLTVRSPVAGVVQGLSLQQGQYMTEGTQLLKVVQPGRLKAVLQIPESQAKDVVVGLKAKIDTRSNGLIPGHVSRKDPSASGGTVLVDVALDGPLPAGAVPDLQVDGTIEIEKLTNVLFTARPGYGGANGGPVGLFKVVDNGHAAIRVQVLLGSTSVTSVQILKGLSKGDKVIMSDMSQFDGVDRVRLKQ